MYAQNHKADSPATVPATAPLAMPAATGVTSPALMAAPGYIARRLYQAYLVVWLREVSASLTGPQFAVLTQVRDSPGADQGSLASLVSIDTSTMTDIAHRLEGKGLLRRSADTADGRRKLLYLTEAGEQVLMATNDRARALDKKLMQPYTRKQSDAVLAELTALAEHWENLA